MTRTQKIEEIIKLAPWLDVEFCWRLSPQSLHVLLQAVQDRVRAQITIDRLLIDNPGVQK